MRVLYVIFVLCVGALVWAAIAAAQHIRRNEGSAERQSELPSRSDEAPSKDEAVLLRPEKSHHD